MSKLYLLTTLFTLAAPILAQASAECYFEADSFQCKPGYVARECFANGHFGVKGCTCCAEKPADSFSFKSFISLTNSKIVADGACQLTRASGTTSFPIHSQTGEKQALGFAGESGARHRLELVNNSDTPFAATSLIQVAVDRDESVKNPPQLCPTQPEDEGIKCQRSNDSLYPPYTHFAAFDNTDGIAIADGRGDVYRKTLEPSELGEGGFVHFETVKRIDGVEASCDLTVSRL